MERKVRLLGTYGSKAEALPHWEKCAAMLKERGMTPRYRVRIVPKAPDVFWLILIDTRIE